MYTIIEDSSEIKRAEEKFKKAFEKLWDRRVHGFVGHKGRSWGVTFNWSKQLGLWAVFDIAEGNRFWNVFGLKEPEKGSLSSIVAEINFPLRGRDRSVAGVFVQDDQGKIIACHSGRIGGGRPGIGKELFKNNYRGGWVLAIDGAKDTELALVGDLNSPRLPYQVKEFVIEVYRIKKRGSGGREKAPEKIKTGFSPEFYGKKHFKLRKEIVSNCDHGYIVGELARKLESTGLKVGNDTHRDLYIINNKGGISAIFEVKPDATQNSLYTGIGQLILNSVGLKKKTRLILVIPESLPKPIASRVREIRIECLTYALREKEVSFPRIDELEMT